MTIMVMISIMAVEGEAERVEEAAAPIQAITLQERQHQVLSGESRYYVKTDPTEISPC